MATVQSLLDKRATIWHDLRNLLDTAEKENRALTAEERQTYARGESDMDSLTDQIEIQQRHDERARQMDSVDRSQLAGAGKPDEPTDEVKYREAFEQMLRHGLGDLDPEQKKLMRRGYTTVDDAEKRAAGVGTNSAGGYTVPPGFRDELIQQMKTYGGMLQVAQILDTDTGAALSWPTNDDTANVGAILAENTQVSEQDVTFGTAQLGAYKYTSKMVRVSEELLQDSAVDIESFLTEALGERIGRILNQHFTTGTGSSQPQGIVTGATTGKTGATGQTTTVLADDLIDLIDSVDPAYQANAQFMMSQATRKVIKKLKDTTGQYLWQPSIQAGAPDRLLGYGYVINQDMPAPAASAKSILFGDFRKAYVIRRVRDFAVRRLDERFADYDQRAFLGFTRADGLVQNAGAIRAYAHPAS